jgi:predicted RNA-binding Zn ribbon-like protein
MTQITIILKYLNALNLTAGQDEVPVIQEVAWASEVREALRDLLRANSGGTPSLASLEIIDRAARIIQVGLGFGSEGSSVRPAGRGLEREVATVLIAVHSAMADGTWERIRTCRNPDCRWAFYDRSRNHSKVWCTMAECGNKMKARRFRQRRKTETAAEGPSSGQK